MIIIAQNIPPQPPAEPPAQPPTAIPEINPRDTKDVMIKKMEEMAEQIRQLNERAEQQNPIKKKTTTRLIDPPKKVDNMDPIERLFWRLEDAEARLKKAKADGVGPEFIIEYERLVLKYQSRILMEFTICKSQNFQLWQNHHKTYEDQLSKFVAKKPVPLPKA